MKILYSIFFCILFATGYSQQTGFDDQISILTKEQKDSVRKEINKMINMSDLYVSSYYKTVRDEQIAFLISLLDKEFDLNVIEYRPFKFSDTINKSWFVLNLYKRVEGVVPSYQDIEANKAELIKENYDSFVSNEAVIGIWTAISPKFPIPDKAIESIIRYYDVSPLMQAKGLVAFKNLSNNQNTSSVVDGLNYFKKKVQENLNKKPEDFDLKEAWAIRVISLSSYLYSSSDEDDIPLLDWTEELKSYFRNGKVVMTGSQNEFADPVTNVYGLWALLELRLRTN